MRKIKLLLPLSFAFLLIFSFVSCFPADGGASDSGNSDQGGNITGEIKSYNVTFDSDGGSEIESQTVKEGGNILKTDSPQKEGYRFIGWKSGAEYWSFAKDKVTSDITLKAHYEPIIYKVTFDVGAGAAEKDIDFTITDIPLTVVLPTARKDDAVFEGWSYDECGERIYDSNITVDKIGNVTLHALYTEATDGLIYKEYYTVCEVTGYTGSEKDVIIPEYHAGKEVYEISSHAFENTDINSVYLPYVMKKITAEAFLGSYSLEKFELPENSLFYFDGNALIERDSKTLVAVLKSPSVPSDGSVYAIGNYAFCLLEGEMDIVIPEGVTRLNTSAFENCINLRSISLPNSISEVGVYAFSGCENLEYNLSGGSEYLGNSDNPHVLLVRSNGGISINNKTKIIYRAAFQNSETLSEIYIPESVRRIDSWAFSGCTSLAKVTIASGVEYIGSDAFRNCRAITGINIPDSVVNIGTYAFAGCTSLENIVFGKGLKTIGSSAFSDCESLNIVVIGENVERIGSAAFSSCTWLRKVIIPKSVKYIGASAFINCRKLTVYAEAESELSTWDAEWKENYISVIFGYSE